MKFSISTLYASADTELEISAEIPTLIAKKINEVIMPLYALNTQKPNWKYNLMLSIDKYKTERKICKLEIYKKQRTENQVVWIPFADLTKEGNSQLENYLNELFEIITLVLAPYQVSKHKLLEIKELIYQEVINNPVYAFKAKYKPDLQAILDKVNQKHQIIPRTG
jgi:hypothetical protein